MFEAGENIDGVSVKVRGAVAEVVLDRAPVNAVSAAMYQRLTAVFRSLGRRTDVHAVILRSAHRHFSAGADIRETLDAPSVSESAAEFRQRLARTCYDAVMECALPTIAVLTGASLGAGAVLAACCDIRVAADDARIGLPEITAGRCGGGSHMMRIAPQGTVRLMYFTGEPLSAEEAYRLDVVQRIHPADQVLEEARALAARIAGNSPLGLRLAKRGLNEAEREAVSEGYAREQRYTLMLGAHPDAAEAAASVIEKRAPQWSWPEVPAHTVAGT